MELLKQIIKLLVLPPAGPLLLALAGLAIALRRPRAGWRLATAGVVLLTLLSLPAVGALLVRLLDDTPPFDLARARDAQAIVILAGGARRYAPEYGGPNLGTVTLERVRYGARLARATGLPVLVSGGSVEGAPPEALLMRNALVHEYGVPVRWAETRSRNTHENALRSTELLRASGVSRVILVGHSFDFPRARNEFLAAGMQVIAAPIGIPPRRPTDVADFIPSARGLQRSYYALYEILANALFHMMPRDAPRPIPAA
jgi:uncharacterized SAM-binding protein YcdF (DUF218 family)